MWETGDKITSDHNNPRIYYGVIVHAYGPCIIVKWDHQQQEARYSTNSSFDCELMKHWKRDTR
jgi:hypothetical protein